MKKILGLFIGILISFSLVGCGGTTPQPQSSLPSWYLSEVPTDSINFYGVAKGSTKDKAKSKALAQISGQISTTVQSTMEMTQTDSTETGYFQESKSNIKSSTDKIKYTGVTIIKTAYVNGEFYTYLKVDREELFNSIKRDLDKEYNEALRLLKQAKNGGSFDVLLNSQKINKIINNILSKPTLEILKSIKPTFDIDKYRTKIIDIKTKLDKLKSNIIIYVYAKNSLSNYYADILKKYISGYELAMVNQNTRAKNMLSIEVDVKAKKKNVKSSDPRLRGASFAQVNITLTTKDYKGKIVAQNIVNVLNISKDGLQQAKIKTKKFEREIKRKGIINILLKQSK